MKRVVNSSLVAALMVNAACPNITAPNNQSSEAMATLETTEASETAEPSDTFTTFADWCGQSDCGRGFVSQPE